MNKNICTGVYIEHFIWIFLRLLILFVIFHRKAKKYGNVRNAKNHSGIINTYNLIWRSMALKCLNAKYVEGRAHSRKLRLLFFSVTQWYLIVLHILQWSIKKAYVNAWSKPHSSAGERKGQRRCWAIRLWHMPEGVQDEMYTGLAQKASARTEILWMSHLWFEIYHTVCHECHICPFIIWMYQLSISNLLFILVIFCSSI